MTATVTKVLETGEEEVEPGRKQRWRRRPLRIRLIWRLKEDQVRQLLGGDRTRNDLRVHNDLVSLCQRMSRSARACSR